MASVQGAMLGAGSITLSGGEVLIHRQWRKMVDVILSHGLGLTVMTNGTKIDKDFCSYLNVWDGHPVQVTISLDGCSQAENDKIRGKGSFKRSIASFELLMKFGLINRVRLQVVVRKGLVYKIDEFVKFAEDFGIPQVTFLFIQRWGRAETNWEAVGLTEKEIERAHHQISFLAKSTAVRLSSFVDATNFAELTPIDSCTFGEDLYISSDGQVVTVHGVDLVS